MREVLTSIGLSPRGGNHETVWSRIEQLGIDATHLRRGRYARPISTASDEEVAAAVAGARSLAEVLRTLGAAGGGSRPHLRRRIGVLGLDASHLRGQGWRRGNTSPPVPALPLERVLVDGRLTNTSRLKRRLIQVGMKQPRCERCGRDQWNGQQIPLELDHIDGRRENNQLSNLRLLCPNCHAQTPNYRGRNIGSRGYARVPRPGGGRQTHRS